jgi:predicted glycoside hydrolase/deacetylase ChbG (UPF0249 family)
MSSRPISLCADDFGLFDAIDAAVMRLVALGRLQAVSCMVDRPDWPARAKALRDAPAGLSIGLHLVLTALPGASPDDRAGAADPSPVGLLVRSLAGLVDAARVRDRIARQLDRFEAATGRRPDHVDGHHHVHAMPSIAPVLHATLVSRYGGDLPWLRFLSPCLPSPTAAARRRVIAGLGAYQERLPAPVPIRRNAGFGGVRSFRERSAYEALLRSQLGAARPDGTLVMCHPATAAIDPAVDEIAAARIGEYELLAGPRFPDLLAEMQCRLSPWSAVLRGA